MNALEFNKWLEQVGEHPCFIKPLIMGIINCTPDSFFDGGAYQDQDNGLRHALHLVEQGADIIDVGGESSKPGALPVSLDEELHRVIPLIEAIRHSSDVCISIDTYKPKVMKEALEAGANVINDITALRQEGSLAIAAQFDVPICLMHMHGQPQTMQQDPCYKGGVIQAIEQFFIERIAACHEAGISSSRLILDPGFGFGKTVAHNLAVLRELNVLKQFKLPVLLGMSRKSTIGFLLKKQVNDRLIGSISLAVYAALHGVNILRVHDVHETTQALHLLHSIYHATETVST